MDGALGNLKSNRFLSRRKHKISSPEVGLICRVSFSKPWFSFLGELGCFSFPCCVKIDRMEMGGGDEFLIHSLVLYPGTLTQAKPVDTDMCLSRLGNKRIRRRVVIENLTRRESCKEWSICQGSGWEFIHMQLSLGLVRWLASSRRVTPRIGRSQVQRSAPTQGLSHPEPPLTWVPMHK
jgi:hypothetical protein